MIKKIFNIILNGITMYALLSWLIYFIDWNRNHKQDIEIKILEWEDNKKTFFFLFIMGVILCFTYFLLKMEMK